MPIFKFIRPDFQIIIFFIECRNLSSRENLSLLPKAWSNSKTRLLSSSHLRVVPRASNFPRLLLFEKMHQPRRKTFDPVARLSPWNFEGEVGGGEAARRITAGDLRSPIAGETDLLASSSREKFRRDAILRSADREEECD